MPEEKETHTNTLAHILIQLLCLLTIGYIYVLYVLPTNKFSHNYISLSILGFKKGHFLVNYIIIANDNSISYATFSNLLYRILKRKGS